MPISKTYKRNFWKGPAKWRSKKSAECQPEQSAEDPAECAICLDMLGADMQMLACGHAFCRPCIGRHVETRRGDGLEANCPMCQIRLTGYDVRKCCPSARARHRRWSFHRASSTCTAAPRSSVPALTDDELSALGLQRCPRCRSAIEKNGGCNHMTCRCGHHFQWRGRIIGSAPDQPVQRGGGQPVRRYTRLYGIQRMVRESSPTSFYVVVVLATPLVATLVVGGMSIATAIALGRCTCSRCILVALAIAACMCPGAFLSATYYGCVLVAFGFVGYMLKMRHELP